LTVRARLARWTDEAGLPTCCPWSSGCPAPSILTPWPSVTAWRFGPGGLAARSAGS